MRGLLAALFSIALMGCYEPEMPAEGINGPPGSIGSPENSKAQTDDHVTGE